MLAQVPIIGPILLLAIYGWLACGLVSLPIFLIADTCQNRAHGRTWTGIPHTLARAPMVLVAGPLYLGMGITAGLRALSRRLCRNGPESP